MCFKNKEIKLYLEYINYTRNISHSHPIIKLVKESVESIHKHVKNLLSNLIKEESKDIGYNFEDLNDLFELERILFIEYEFSINLKKINFLIYLIKMQLDEGMNNPEKVKNSEKLFISIQDKCSLIKNIISSENSVKLYEECLNYISDKILIRLIHIYFQDFTYLNSTKQIDKINFVLEILRNLFVSDNNYSSIISASLISTFKTILSHVSNYFYIYIDGLTKNNESYVKRYLSGTKDIKKLLSSPLEASVSDKQDIRNSELLVIIYNNINFLFSEITDKHPLLIMHHELNTLPVIEKNKILGIIKNHFENILSTINNYLEDNMFLIKIELHENEIIIFKNSLFDFSSINNEGILLTVLDKIYKNLGLNKLWEIKDKEKIKTNYERYLKLSLEYDE
jgi:hypothetical protein